MKPLRTNPILPLILLTAVLLTLLLPVWQAAAQPDAWSISGTVIYYGRAIPPVPVEVGVQEVLGAAPVATVNTAVPVDTFTFSDSPDGAAVYLYAFLDMNSSGGPPDTGDLVAYYDGNHDGEPDLLNITSDMTGLNIALGNLVYVNEAAAGANDGSSWTDAYPDLQTALAAANTDTEIWVTQGTYHPTTSSDRTQTFQMKNGVSIYGGFAGTETFRHQRDWQQQRTILSGDIGVAGVAADNSYNVVIGSGVDNTAVLDGITITGGYADGSGSYDKGGGLHITGGSPTIMNAAFMNNFASNHGAGMMVQSAGSVPLLVNCLFSGNSTTYNGAIASLYSANPTLVNITIVGNNGGNGGGIVNLQNGQATVANSIIWGNGGGQIGLQSGGSIAISYSLVTGGYTGTGNIDATPIFVDADGPDDVAGTLDDDFRLQMTSPGVDAGDNTAVPTDGYDHDGDGNLAEPIPVDLAGLIRMTDVAFAADSGSGSTPIVDMGAFEVAVGGDVLVNQNGGTDQAGCGQGSSPPCATIAYAVNTIASAGSTVLVGPGTYTDAVTMQPGVDVIGQYGPAVTILDGGGVRGPLVAANGSSFSTPVLFAGVTVQHGYTAVTGGGIQIHNGAQMVISNTHIISNSAGINDGGISVRDGSSLQLVDCLVAENTQSGLWMSDGTAVVNNCIFRDNVGNSWGGGIGSEMVGALTVSDSSFIANSAPYGGGIMNSAAAFTLTNSIFISNTASSTGGGVHVRDGSTFTISGSTFSNNEANQGAGLLVASGSGGATSGSVSTNSFTANVASGLGGGVKLEDAATQVSIENNQLANNSADGGGGIHLTDSVATIQSNTLIGNTSSSNGGGIRILGSTGVTVTQNSLNQNEAANNGGAIATENVTNLLVAGNIVTNNVGGLDFAATSGVIENNLVANTDVALSTSAVKLRQNSTVTLRHNTLVGDGSGYGVNVTFGSTPVIANNIISDYAGGILGTGTVTPTLSHNLLWRIPALYDGVGAGSSDLVRDPDFVDVSTQDYHLGVCSFAVEAGDMAFGAVVDIDGETRPFSGFGSGTAITDIGADERLSVSIPPPWAGFTTTIAGLTVDFSNTTTNAAGYSWDFGDGTAVSTATSPRHTYTAPGTYLVTLTAVNANSCQDVVQVQVAVENYRVYLPLVVKP